VVSGGIWNGELDGSVWEVYYLMTPLPPPYGMYGINNFGGNRELIYELHSLKGKILSRKELQSATVSRRLLSVSWIGISRSRSGEHWVRWVLWKNALL
jgi:hypothetical protein